MPLLAVVNELIFFMDCGGLCDRKIFTAEFTAMSIKKNCCETPIFNFNFIIL